MAALTLARPTQTPEYRITGTITSVSFSAFFPETADVEIRLGKGPANIIRIPRHQVGLWIVGTEATITLTAS